MIVMKFGGTSTQDAPAIRNVVGIVSERRDQQPVVVISAIAQATNTLEQAGMLASQGRLSDAQKNIQALIERHAIMIDELIKHPQRHDDIRTTLRSSLEQIIELLSGIAILRELTPRTLDTLYSYGELLSSRIVAVALQERGIDAIWIDTKDFMTTDDQFNQASPIMEVVSEKLTALALPLLTSRKVPVTQGFIGATSTGRRTTMGRESSDFSAAVIGAVLHANDIQIWTDVDGVLTADPRVVAEPKKLTRLSFQEAYELSFFGAKVLHPNTMLPAIEKNIPIHIYNSRHAKRSGTLVSFDGDENIAFVKSVAYKRNVVLLRVMPKRRSNQFVVWEHVYNVLTKYGATVTVSTTSEYSMAVVVNANVNIEGIIHEIEETGSVQRVERQGIICIVGTQIRKSPDIMKKIFAALSGFEINGMAFGASQSNMILLLDDDRLIEAVKNIHAELFDAVKDTSMFEMLPQSVMEHV